MTPRTPRSSAGERQRGGDRGDAVRGGQGELVGRLQPGPREQVRHRGLLGRDPDHRDRLDEEGGDRGPADDQRRRCRRAARPAGSRRRARTAAGRRRPWCSGGRTGRRSTPAIGPSTSAGSSRTAITPPNATPLAVLPATCAAAKIDGGEQAEPVAEGGDAEHDPQPAERPDAQHRAERRDAGRSVRRLARAGRRPTRRTTRRSCWLSMAVPPRAGPALGSPGGTL